MQAILDSDFCTMSHCSLETLLVGGIKPCPQASASARSFRTGMLVLSPEEAAHQTPIFIELLQLDALLVCHPVQL